MELDLNRIVSSLREAKAGPVVSLTPVTPYVWRHIYEPLAAGKKLLFADLDFKAFSPDDLVALENRLNEQESVFGRLTSVNQVFCNADPVSAAVRTFC